MTSKIKNLSLNLTFTFFNVYKHNKAETCQIFAKHTLKLEKFFENMDQFLNVLKHN